jgi:hypothetical protein
MFKPDADKPIGVPLLKSCVLIVAKGAIKLASWEVNLPCCCDFLTPSKLPNNLVLELKSSTTVIVVPWPLNPDFQASVTSGLIHGCNVWENTSGVNSVPVIKNNIFGTRFFILKLS